MIWQNSFAIACVALSVAITTAAQEPQDLAAAQGAAIKASPDLVESLSKELGSTPEQAAGAAGALFGIAKSRLGADDFAQVSKAVPGMSELLKAAPGSKGSSGAAGRMSDLSHAVGTAGALAPAASAFSQLGLKPELVSKAVPALTSFVTKSGGADVGRLLAGALK